MPLTIGEIGIRVRVEPKPGPVDRRAPAGSPTGAEEREQLIQECIRRTLAVLDARKER